MLVYFNENGQLLERLEYGAVPRVGTTNFKIIAYFENLNSLDGIEGSIRLFKPGLNVTSYPPLIMSKDTDFVFDSEIEHSNYFVDGERYSVLVLDFANFSEGLDEVMLLDTNGTWKAVITLIGNNYNVQGVIPFLVQGISLEDETNIDIDILLENIRKELAKKIDLNSGFYLRVINETDISEGILSYTNYGGEASFIQNCVLFTRDTHKFYILTNIDTGEVTEIIRFATELEVRSLFQQNFEISVSVQNGTYEGDNYVAEYGDASITITANQGYVVPNDVVVSGATYTYEHTDTQGLISLSNAIQNVTIIANCQVREYNIVTGVTNGTFSGNTTILSNGTATVTIVPNTGYLVPSSVIVSGADFTYLNGVVSLSNPTSNVTITAVCPPTLPVKGDVIRFAPKTDNVNHNFRVIKMTGTTALLMDTTEDSGSMAYNTSTRTTTYNNGSTYQNYDGSNVDNYCNSTYYGALKQTVKDAIVPATRVVSVWNKGDYHNGQLSSYDFKMNSRSQSSAIVSTEYTYKRTTSKTLSSTRNCFALDLDDIKTYFGWTASSSIYGPDIYNIFGNGTTTWLASASSITGNSSYPTSVHVTAISHSGSETDFGALPATINIPSNGCKVQPAFQIDLSQIEFQKL